MSMYMHIHASFEKVKPYEPGSVPIINLIYLFTIKTRTAAIKDLQIRNKVTHLT